MSLQNFIPQLWSARILHNLNKNLVYAQAGIVNRDYEGEIKNFGDTVKINNIGRVTVKDYTKGQTIAPPDELTGAQRILSIDQAKYFNFAIDDIDVAQQNPKVMDEATLEAAYALADKSDQFIAGLYTGVQAGNTIGDDTTPVALTPDLAYDSLVDLGTKLTEANVPKQGRWVVVPPFYTALLSKANIFKTRSTPETDTVLRNGFLGRIAGFDVLESNNVPNTAGAKYKIMAGHQMAISYAEQISELNAYEPQDRFADALKGLHVYGGKLVRPEAIAVLTANKA